MFPCNLVGKLTSVVLVFNCYYQILHSKYLFARTHTYIYLQYLFDLKLDLTMYFVVPLLPLFLKKKIVKQKLKGWHSVVPLYLS